jgi:hypothetical protein
VITLVPVGRIDEVWPHVRAALEYSCLKTGGDISSADLWQSCRRGESFLIVAHDGEKMQAASVWRPETWLTGRKLRCQALAGKNMKSWLGEMREVATQLARDCGASSIITEGRKGWAAVFPKARILRVLYEEAV